MHDSAERRAAADCGLEAGWMMDDGGAEDWNVDDGWWSRADGATIGWIGEG